MPKFTATRRVDLTVDQAFAIAADVASYKDFLPLLKRSVIRGDRKVEGSLTSFDADLQVAVEKIGFTETFRSHVTTNSETHQVTATSSDGPLKSMKTAWTITAAGTQADVSISVDYTLKNMLLQMMAGGIADFAAQKVMTAFEERGRKLYGVRAS